MQKLRGFLIDPEAKTITEVVHNGDYKQIYQFIGVDLFTVVRIDDVNIVFVDDEGLLKNPRYFFKLGNYPQPLAGRGLILGTDEQGETIGTNLELEDLKPLVRFEEHSVRGWITTEQDNVEIFAGITGFSISTVPVFGPPDKEDKNG